MRPGPDKYPARVVDLRGERIAAVRFVGIDAAECKGVVPRGKGPVNLRLRYRAGSLRATFHGVHERK